MTITKPNGDVITCTVEEYKQIYKPTMEVVNIPSVWFPQEHQSDTISSTTRDTPTYISLNDD